MSLEPLARILRRFLGMRLLLGPVAALALVVGELRGRFLLFRTGLPA